MYIVCEEVTQAKASCYMNITKNCKTVEDNKQAEAHAEVLAEVLEVSFPSKQDSNAAITNLSHEINNLRNEMNVKFADVKSEVIKWVFGISFAQAVLIISVLKFFH